MCDQERLTRPVVVSLPAEIDNANAEPAGGRLRAAFAPGVTVVAAEIGSTVFCCPFGRRQLVAAHKRAMGWLTTPGPGIGDCHHANHLREIAEANFRGSRRPCAGCRPMSLPGIAASISYR